MLGEAFIGGPARLKLKIRQGVHVPIIHSVDWVPTLSAITGGAPNGVKYIDGINQLSVLQGGPPVRSSYFLGYSVKGTPGDGKYGPRKAYTALRSQNFKLVRHPNRATYSLFDLSKDRGEKRDVARNYPRMVQAMKARMIWYEKRFIAAALEDKSCPRITFMKTSWGQLAWRPWCSVPR